MPAQGRRRGRASRTAQFIVAAIAGALALTPAGLGATGPAPDPAPVPAAPAPAPKPVTTVTPPSSGSSPSGSTSSSSSAPARARRPPHRAHRVPARHPSTRRPVPHGRQLLTRPLVQHGSGRHREARARTRAKAARVAALERAKARARAKQDAAARKKAAREARLAPFTPPVIATSSSSGDSNSLTLWILAVAAFLVLLAVTPARVAYALGPRAGDALAHGRMTLAGVGVAVALGTIVALGMGASL